MAQMKESEPMGLALASAIHIENGKSAKARFGALRATSSRSPLYTITPH